MTTYHRTFCSTCKGYHVFEDGKCIACSDRVITEGIQAFKEVARMAQEVRNRDWFKDASELSRIAYGGQFYEAS